MKLQNSGKCKITKKGKDRESNKCEHKVEIQEKCDESVM